jgi:single-strand DNA-binding protein
MNSVSISGNLGKDCEVRHLPTGDMVCGFSVADNMGRDKPTIWWRCNMFGKRAEALSQYLTKGQQVTVIGSMTERKWVDKDGEPRTSMEVRVSDVALMGGKREQTEAPRPTPRAAPARIAEPAGSGFDDMDDSIPFITASAYYDMTTSKARRMKRT